jgi:hypothetical protein
MGDIQGTRTGQTATETGDDVGRRMADEAQQEIDRHGLGSVFRVWYVANEHVVRLDRLGPWGDPQSGLDYPPHPSFLSVLLEHVQLLARSRRR